MPHDREPAARRAGHYPRGCLANGGIVFAVVSLWLTNETS